MTVNFIMHVEARAGTVTRVGIATREPISMVISRRPIIEYAKYVYADWTSLFPTVASLSVAIVDVPIN